MSYKRKISLFLGLNICYFIIISQMVFGSECKRTYVGQDEDVDNKTDVECHTDKENRRMEEIRKVENKEPSEEPDVIGSIITEENLDMKQENIMPIPPKNPQDIDENNAEENESDVTSPRELLPSEIRIISHDHIPLGGGYKMVGERNPVNTTLPSGAQQ